MTVWSVPSLELTKRKCPSGEYSVLGAGHDFSTVVVFHEEWQKCLMKKPLPNYIFFVFPKAAEHFDI